MCYNSLGYTHWKHNRSGYLPQLGLQQILHDVLDACTRTSACRLHGQGWKLLTPCTPDRQSNAWHTLQQSNFANKNPVVKLLIRSKKWSLQFAQVTWFFRPKPLEYTKTPVIRNLRRAVVGLIAQTLAFCVGLPMLLPPPSPPMFGFNFHSGKGGGSSKVIAVGKDEIL